MEKKAFPRMDDPDVCYYKGPNKVAGVYFALLAVTFFIVWVSRKPPNAYPFGVLLLWVACGGVAIALLRTKTAATKTCVFYQPPFGALKMILVSEFDGYTLSGNRYGSTVILLRGRQRILGIECTAALINYLTDLGLRAQDSAGWQI